MKQFWIAIGRLACGALLGTFVFAAAASAQSGGGAVVVTFSGPVRLPNVLLPPGTYTFDAPSWSHSQDMVVVYNDHNEFVTLARVMPKHRPESGATRVVMSESPSAPPRITTVYISGSTMGYEFVYNRPAGTLLADKQPSAR